MNAREWSQMWHHRQLNLSLLQAYYAVHAYTRHSHDYYVVALVDGGLQSFSCAGDKHVTPPDGLILLNPGDAHTGEPMGEQGFAYRAIYPTVDHFKSAYFELTGRQDIIPRFPKPRVDDPLLTKLLRQLHRALQRDTEEGQSTLETESRLLWTLVQIIERHGDHATVQSPVGQENNAIRHVCDYIHTHYAEKVSLAELAAETNLSRYHLLRTFRNAMGMPPHAYLESVRISHAEQMLRAGKSLADVAYAIGYSSQPHFTQRFKQIIGVTPGKYVQHG